QFDAAHETVAGLVHQREELSREIAEAQQRMEQLRATMGDRERERRGSADRLALLEEWRRNMEGFSDGLRTLLQTEDAERPPLIGVVSQLISVPPGKETAVEAALGPFLHAAILPTRQDAHQAARWLRERNSGRATMLWLDATPANLPAPDMPEADGERFFGFAHDALQC